VVRAWSHPLGGLGWEEAGHQQGVAVGMSEGASVDPLLRVRRFGEDEAAAGAAGVTGGA
jgi:hypothetical protein